MSASPLRIGIVGAGANTRGRHIPELRRIPGVEVVSVANRTRESGQRVAEHLGIPKVYERWEELVAADDTDAIVIGTWPYRHCEITLAALAAGKHVLCEARMASDLDEARRMHAAAQEHPALVTQVVPSPMTLGVDRSIVRLLDEGFLGELLAVDIQASGQQFVDRDSPLHWRQSRAYSGSNILTMGIWYEALQRWIGGASRVFAQGRTVVAERLDPETARRAPVTVPDHLDILATMEIGAQARLQFSAVTGLAPEASATLYGSDGTLQFRAADESLHGARRGAVALERLPLPGSERGGWRVEAEFVGAIRGEEPICLTTFADGVRYMEFTEAVRLSLEMGQPIELPLP